MNKVEPRTLSGFMELLPNDQLKFNRIYDVIRSTYEEFGFLPLDTPIIEASEVLLAKAGGETEKQVYRFQKGDSDLTIRFDLTVPLAKYVAKNYGMLAFPFRRYQMGKVFRGERPQKGRFREFYQCDIDIIGDGELSVINDAEIANIIAKIFTKLSFGDFLIRINNRKIMNGLLSNYQLNDKSVEIIRIIDKIDKIGTENVILELKDLKIEDNIISEILSFINITGTNEEIMNKLKNINISNEMFKLGIVELEQVYNCCKLFGIKDENLQIDLRLSRGFDYYTGTVYETVLKDHKELGSVCGGGRYDNLAEFYTDKKLPGVGISIGLTRLFDQLLDLNILKDENVKVSDVLIIPMSNNYEYIINCYNELTNDNIKAQLIYDKKSFKSMINYAINQNIPYVIFIGDDEIKANKITIKILATHEQITDSIDKIKELIKHE